MSDLISRCELFNRLAPVQTLGEAYGIIQGMETVDAVPVVRCKDCKYWEKSMSNRGYCKDMYGFGRWWKADDHCSYGVKDGDHHEG